MIEDKKEKAAKHIEKELCIVGINVAYEVRCMLDACEKAVINRVLEIVNKYDGIEMPCQFIRKEVEALEADKEGE